MSCAFLRGRVAASDLPNRQPDALLPGVVGVRFRVEARRSAELMYALRQTALPDTDGRATDVPVGQRPTEHQGQPTWRGRSFDRHRRFCVRPTASKDLPPCSSTSSLSERLIVECGKTVRDSLHCALAFLDSFLRSVKVEQAKVGQPRPDD